MFRSVWYNSVMLYTRAYTPEQVSDMLQLSKNTVYELIKNGDIAAKKIGKVYRVPPSSLSFIFTGLDYDLYQKEQLDKENLENVSDTIKNVRSNKWQKLKSI